MGKFDKYKIDLKGMQEKSCDYEFKLDNQFFAAIDAPEVSKGKVCVALNVKRLSGGGYELLFQTDGIVQVACDRCLDDMDQEITSSDKLMVKLGSDYAEKDDWVIIPEEEGEINVAWFIYEFITLSVPLKHVHGPGKCNKAMTGRLSKHLRVAADDEESVDYITEGDEVDGLEEIEQEIDPRWNELKKILDNN